MSSAFMNTYHRLPVTFESGEGAILTDVNGNQYIDWTSGIAVNCLGHNYPPLVNAISAQAAKLLHTSNYFESDISNAFAEKLCAVSKMNKVFLCNSGAEANECAIKIARKYSFKKYGEGRHTIVTLLGGFHGRTITTLSATGQEKFHVNFGPWTQGFSFIPPQALPPSPLVSEERSIPANADALDAALDSKTAALMLEPIQGESGVIPLDGAFVKRAAELCAERDILLIFDEVQSGVGRTGKFFAHEHFGVRADIATLAKGLAGGIPIGAALANEKTADVLETGDHGSTFGGNPLAAAAGLVVLDKIGNDNFLSQINELGNQLMDGLQALDKKKILSVRGKGLMIACDIPLDAWDVLVKLISLAKTETEGLLLLSAGAKTLRFLPPYIISKEEIDRGLRLLDRVLK
ncbi:MAG: aspartate aminotransferase family protein [Spirochaetaceae bacterium]|jgi:acetylornithine/N-succinyldiaminopimelate aminotransferase|nr:aspartate aminotransferase family protein [Spirochaetaceae bacterium]